MTSSSTRSGRGDRYRLRSRRRDGGSASLPRQAVEAAVGEARAVDASRSRRGAGAGHAPAAPLRYRAGRLLSDRPDGLAASRLAATSVNPWVLLGCVTAHAVASSNRVRDRAGLAAADDARARRAACSWCRPSSSRSLRSPARSCRRRSSVARTGTQRERLPVLIGSAVYALGPALVFFVAHISTPRLADWPVYVLAAAAQIAFDTLATWFLNCFRLGVPLGQLASRSASHFSSISCCSPSAI